ncbi:hypothetical protein [Paenibacillus hexagrammi]|uniref:Uncharacterized protein n=1 Tax=Paenibacillus hexagrammi TaxID=2908839 RepID=A0ABY3SLK4_9BACL|nr:hypothetical protein [Paenibacillus sp. YPD9-1]UJF34934.1 hypothetical protein L0M14_07250 [Paenibacillus sp. YPD9-1]
MVKESMTLGQFMIRPQKPSRTRRPVLLIRIPGGKKTAKLIRYVFT